MDAVLPQVRGQVHASHCRPLLPQRFFYISVISVCVCFSLPLSLFLSLSLCIHGFLTLLIVRAAFCYAHRVVIEHIMMGATNPDGSIVPGLEPISLIH